MLEAFTFIFKFLLDFWWLILPALLIQIVWEKFVDNQKGDYRKKMEWDFLEIKFPTGITRDPQAMEEVFNALHAIHPNPEKDLTWWNLNIKGFAPKTYAFLMVAHNGKLKFYLRFPKELKDFVKTRFYSQYPEIQFEESGNPLDNLPPFIPNSLFDIEIFDARLSKEDAYPIKTYTVFKNLPKEQRIDPISTFSEGATQISDKEWLIFQLLTLPTTPDNSSHGKKWVERGNKVINKLLGKEEPKKPPVLDEVWEFLVNLLLAPVRPPQWKTEEKKEAKEIDFQKLTPAEKKIITSIQEKLTKFGYWCNLRIVYLAKRDVFETNKNAITSLILSILKNFSTEDLNSFKLTSLTSISKKHPLIIFFIKAKEYGDFLKFKNVSLPPRVKAKLKDPTLGDGFILNSEEMASLFHPPMEFVPPTGLEKIPFREFPPLL